MYTRVSAMSVAVCKCGVCARCTRMCVLCVFMCAVCTLHVCVYAAGVVCGTCSCACYVYMCVRVHCVHVGTRASVVCTCAGCVRCVHVYTHV